MDAHTALDEWETSPFDGGLDEAARLAERGFSGAIRAGRDWLFLADGDPVAVVTDLDGEPSVGDVDAFEGASGETLEAPTAAVARLAPMLALGGEVRGEYFSDDTPVGTVQDTLEDGGFTGYVELAENVLSGDYYVVFADGVAEYVAFIGSTEQLVTGAEAERKTKNEVGIYSVTAVDLPDVALPDVPDDAGGAGGAVAGGAAGAGATGGASDSTSASDPTDATGPADAGEATEDDAGVTDAAGDQAEVGQGDAAAASKPADDQSPTDDPSVDPTDDTTDDTTEDTTDDTTVDPTDDTTVDDPAGGADDATTDASGAGADIGVGAGRAEPLEDDASGASDRADPSVEPATSEPGADGSATGGEGSAGEGDAEDTAAERGSAGADTDVSGVGAGPALSSSEPSPGGESAGASADAVEALRGDLRELRSAIDRLEGRVAALESAGDADTAAAARTGGPSLSPAEALSKTTLFVREGTRGGPTLEDGHDGTADRSAVAQNVGLERHTRFEDAGATVDGEPYATFLEDSQAYRFVEWLTTDLLFEIRNTDSAGAMSKLYDALPEVDRVFFNETVTVSDGQESVDLTFDVVVRDRNGAPLFVATLDDSRDPTPSTRIETLVTDASDFCAADGTLVGAFAVTSSYFETDALEVAQEATTSSLLSRGTYRSYVNLTRKNGFHLCLVEARDSSLHLTVPEL